ncbi:MAG: KGK domain-containing protein [Rivularia sp. (in: cyanobacteria)]|jgi:hypothetical protein
MTERIILKDNDVVWMEKKQSPCGNTTNLVREVNSALCYTNLTDSWIRDGVGCSVLFTNKDGWKKGKIRIKLEFIPDEPFMDDAEPGLLLDDLREQLDI